MAKRAGESLPWHPLDTVERLMSTAANYPDGSLPREIDADPLVITAAGNGFSVALMCPECGECHYAWTCNLEDKETQDDRAFLILSLPRNADTLAAFLKKNYPDMVFESDDVPGSLTL